MHPEAAHACGVPKYGSHGCPRHSLRAVGVSVSGLLQRGVRAWKCEWRLKLPLADVWLQTTADSERQAPTKRPNTQGVGESTLELCLIRPFDLHRRKLHASQAISKYTSSHVSLHGVDNCRQSERLDHRGHGSWSAHTVKQETRGLNSPTGET